MRALRRYLYAPLNGLCIFNVFLMVLLDSFHGDDWKSLKPSVRVGFRFPTVVRQSPYAGENSQCGNVQKNMGRFLICAGSRGATSQFHFSLDLVLINWVD